MANELVEDGVTLLWRSKPEWWELQRKLITLAGIRYVNSKTTLDEYHAILDKIKEDLEKKGEVVNEITMSPSWVTSEIQADRLTLTARNISIILCDPIGIGRKGF